MPIRRDHLNASWLQQQEGAVQRVARFLVRDGERSAIDQSSKHAGRHLSQRFGNIRQRRELVFGQRRKLEEGPTGTDLDPLVLLGADTDLPFGQGPNDFEQASRRCSRAANSVARGGSASARL